MLFRKYSGKVIRKKNHTPPLFTKKTLIFGFLTAGVLSAVFYGAPFLEDKPKKPERPPSSISDNEIQSKVKSNFQKIRLKKQIAKDNAVQEGPPLDLLIEEESESQRVLTGRYPSKPGVELDQERLFDEVIAEIEGLELLEEERGSEDIENQISRYQNIEDKLKLYQQTQTAVKDENTNFIEAFVENARKKGYAVEINESLDVVSVKKINLPHKK